MVSLAGKELGSIKKRRFLRIEKLLKWWNNNNMIPESTESTEVFEKHQNGKEKGRKSECQLGQEND